MIRALYTGTSGMRVQQHKIDSIGNNIANTQTIGYKRSRPDFKEALYDVIENRPAKAGPSLWNGTVVGSVQTYFTQGGLYSTNSLDLALEVPVSLPWNPTTELPLYQGWSPQIIPSARRRTQVG